MSRVTAVRVSAPRRSASASRTAIPVADSWPGNISKRPAPVRRYPVSNKETTIASSEKPRGSSFARAMNANTSSSFATVDP